MGDHATVGSSSGRELPEKERNPTGKKKQRRSQIACVHCNRRRARCNASTIGLPCSACTDLGLADCQFIQSKRRWSKNAVRKLTPVTPIEFPPSLERGSPAATMSHDAGKADATDATEFSYGSDESSPAESNESETWTKAANVVSVGNEAGDVTVEYLGCTWLIPAAQKYLDSSLSAPPLKSHGTSWSPSYPFAATFYTQMISVFFTSFHTIFPVIDRRDFDESLRAKTLSTLMLETVILAGVTHCKEVLLEKAGFANRMEAIRHFYSKVSAGFDAAQRGETLVLIQCMFILQFYWMSPTDWKDTKFWLSTAIRQAQFLGLHKKSEVQKLDAPKQRLCCRLWWSLYIRDRQCASAMGIPIMIQDEDCDVEEPCIDDMEKEMTLEAKHSFLQLVKLMQEVKSILQTEFGPASTRSGRDRKATSRQEVISACERWQAGIPPEIKSPSNKSGIAVFHLHISFYSQILIFNRSITQHHDGAVAFIDVHALIASHAASMITTLANQLATNWGQESLPFNSVYSVFAAITVQIVERNNRDVVDALKDDKMLQNMTCLRHLADTYPIAMWIGKLINKVIGMSEGSGAEFPSYESNQNSYTSALLSKSPPTVRHLTRPKAPPFRNLFPSLSKDPHPQMSNSLNEGRESEPRLLKPPEIFTRIDFNDRRASTVEMGNYLAASYPAPNANDQSPQFMDDWQAVYSQLELEKLF